MTSIPSSTWWWWWWWSVAWCVVLATTTTTTLWAAPGGHLGVDADGVVDDDDGRSGERRGAGPQRDHHGGVPMGMVPGCDDAKTGIEVDWDPQSSEEYICDEDFITPTKTKVIRHCESQTSEPIHVCLPTEISYVNTPPTSGRHRPNWPAYGEYLYVPPQRWLHSLEHGAVVMLYHPCADPGEVSALRDLVRSCLRRHIISPYRLLPPDTPLALLTWGCRLMMSDFRPALSHACRGPEGNVASGGQYKAGLLNSSRLVSDYHDTQLCPNFRPALAQKSRTDSSTTTTTIPPLQRTSPGDEDAVKKSEKKWRKLATKPSASKEHES
ncbi:uncharacterized protein LOC143274824 isoform X2 [Babylonia areolata]|uniref:uncharacterized protein LOC143274824 isoform X2 n=1 Tax=Babylonia areolata TaxID=304850 RepID=UPI003FD02C43